MVEEQQEPETVWKLLVIPALKMTCFHHVSGQDLLPQHGNSNGTEMNGSIRLASPLSSQPTGATLTITNDHLLPQSPANTGMTGESWNINVCLCLNGQKNIVVESHKVYSNHLQSLKQLECLAELVSSYTIKGWCHCWCPSVMWLPWGHWATARSNLHFLHTHTLVRSVRMCIEPLTLEPYITLLKLCP